VELPVYGDREVMLKDHATTMDLYKILVDTRFKLLTFVPTVTTIAVGILSLDKQQNIFVDRTTLLVGLAGITTSLAIVVYEIRNSQIHDRVVHRIKHLERLLGFTPSYAGRAPRGIFGERGTGERLFGVFTVQHDRALSMVYGVVLALWTWISLTGLGDFVGWFDSQEAWPGVAGKAAISGMVGLAIAVEISRQGGIGREPAIIYTLADLLVEAERTDVAARRTNGGAKIWSGLRTVQICAEGQPSLYDLVCQVGSDDSSGGGATYAEKLVNLAIASDMIAVRQRLCPPWNPRAGREKALNVIPKGPLPSPESLSAAIVGGREVLKCLRANVDLPLGTSLALSTLMPRYGPDAPWCSRHEIRLRWELLSSASDAS
jgi:hypothetical protein